MKSPSFYGLIVASGMLAMTTTAVLAEPINVKTGLWETTIRTAGSGELPIPPEELQRMSPQMREAAKHMLANASVPHATVTRHCFTQKELDTAASDFLSGEPGMKCSNRLSSHTSSHVAGTVNCTKGSMHQSGEFSFDVLDREHMRGKVNMTFNNGGNEMTTRGTMSSHWVSASCGDVK